MGKSKPVRERTFYCCDNCWLFGVDGWRDEKAIKCKCGKMAVQVGRIRVKEKKSKPKETNHC